MRWVGIAKKKPQKAYTFEVIDNGRLLRPVKIREVKIEGEWYELEQTLIIIPSDSLGVEL